LQDSIICSNNMMFGYLIDDSLCILFSLG
jgi:hypothetical protein